MGSLKNPTKEGELPAPSEGSRMLTLL